MKGESQGSEKREASGWGSQPPPKLPDPDLVVENLFVVCFSNFVFELLMFRDYFFREQLRFSEDIRTHGREGYFGKSGIIHDVMQNHLWLSSITLMKLVTQAKDRENRKREKA